MRTFEKLTILPTEGGELRDVVFLDGETPEQTAVVSSAAWACAREDLVRATWIGDPTEKEVELALERYGDQYDRGIAAVLTAALGRFVPVAVQTEELQAEVHRITEELGFVSEVGSELLVRRLLVAVEGRILDRALAGLEADGKFGGCRG